MILSERFHGTCTEPLFPVSTGTSDQKTQQATVSKEGGELKMNKHLIKSS